MYIRNWSLNSLRFISKSSKISIRRKAEDSIQKTLEKLQEYDTPLTHEAIRSDSSRVDWRPVNDEPKPGFAVPTRFRISLNQRVSEKDMSITYSRDVSSTNTYTDFCGLRFPTLETTRNRNYWKDSGLNRILPRIFPITLPTHRKVDPLMREYIYFIHTLDPARFRIERIGERYGFKSSTVSKIIKEFSLLHYINKNKLCKIEDKRIDLSEQRLQIKEAAYRDNVGYIQRSNEQEDSELEYKGDKDTVDWLYRQSVIAESMSAFPYPSTRKPMPKRVDVDLTVKNDKNVKVINWIDPTDKVVI
ncbi:hypothetical protein MACJ_002345 [Theileria orientalis]|uniref:Uncharacterized protein n=1 Tax=Theileria orientalis TaxID=68886 RepID=A0A976M609_THEOR|nr:hypothetical protein MACJ_002345 [Theileria orientalis]